MKIRTGFVSNSSSCSYTCSLCGHEVIGQDIGLDEAEMFRCQNRHYICNEHLSEDGLNGVLIKELSQLSPAEIENYFKKINESTLKYFYSDNGYENIEQVLEENGEFYPYGLNSIIDYYKGNEDLGDVADTVCPICQMKGYSEKELIKYYFKKHDLTYDQIFNQVKEEFKDYTSFNTYIKGK